MEVAGLDPDKDVTRRAMGVGESSAALREGSIDAFVWSGGLPTGAITDLATTDEIVLLPLDRYVPLLNERYGEAYQESEVEEGEYPGVPATKTIAVPNLLMVRSDMDETLAHDLIKLMFDHKARAGRGPPVGREAHARGRAGGRRGRRAAPGRRALLPGGGGVRRAPCSLALAAAGALAFARGRPRRRRPARGRARRGTATSSPRPRCPPTAASRSPTATRSTTRPPRSASARSTTTASRSRASPRRAGGCSSTTRPRAASRAAGSSRPTRRASRRWRWPRPSAAAARSWSAARASRSTATACT